MLERCCCGVAFKFQPSSVADGRDLLGCEGRSWSWMEGCLDSFACSPGAVSPSWAPRAFI